MEAKAAAAHSAFAALISIGSSALCYSHTAHAALVAPRLGGQDDAAVGLRITVVGELQ